MKNKSFWLNFILSIVIIVILIVISLVVSSFFGIRVVYDPAISIDWDATGTIIELIGVLLVPFIIVFIQHKLDMNKQDIAISNMVTVQELEEFKKEHEKLLHISEDDTIILDGGNVAGYTKKSPRDKIIQYIGVSMGATTTQIAERLDLSLATVSRILKQLLDEGVIQSTGNVRNRIYKLSK